MHKHHKNILIFSLLTLFAVIVLIGAYGDMNRQPGYFSDTTYPFIFGGCLIWIVVFLLFIFKEYRLLEDKIEDMAVKSRVFDMMREIKQ